MALKLKLKLSMAKVVTYFVYMIYDIKKELISKFKSICCDCNCICYYESKCSNSGSLLPYTTISKLW